MRQTIDCDTIKAEGLREEAAMKNGHTMRDSISYISGLFSRLNSEIGSLFSLHIDLLKVEMRDSAKTLAINSTLVIIGAFLAVCAFGAVSLAIIGFIANALPLEGFMAFAVGALIVGAVYALIAGILVLAGIKHLQKSGLKPERSIAEVRRDKEWVKEIRT